MFNHETQWFHIPLGYYPQRGLHQEAGWRQVFDRYWPTLIHRMDLRPAKQTAFVSQVKSYNSAMKDASVTELMARILPLRYRMRKEGINDHDLAQLFAVICEMAVRTLAMQPFANQIAGAWAMMRGRIIEMDTGEGKSLCAALTAASSALLGVPVHIITVNEYLANRDAEYFRPLYESLNLAVGCVTAELSEKDKQSLYRRDVVYCTNKQVTFDYLRDRIKLQNDDGPTRLQLEPLFSPTPRKADLLLQGLHFAIVDEADSILIDEAITPLIISASQQGGQKRAFYSRALLLAQQLKLGRDYHLLPQERQIQFSQDGLKRMDSFGQKWGGLWRGTRPRDELVSQALKALHFFVLGQHYLIQQGKVVIVDEFTGRTMADRSWESGLHQMIELKEGCEMTEERATLAKISYQRFFRRYVNLAGMTGTAMEVRQELKRVYELDVYRIERELPRQSKLHPIQYFALSEQKWRAISLRIEQYYREGKACLVGTRTVAASQHLHQLLTAQAIPHQLLNAENPEQEADIVAQAGQPGQITIATNMAGRGTDIKISPVVRDIGGLHIIATEKHESGRIDRQLYGRCGRQGDPGQIEVFLSLEDELITKEWPRWLIAALQNGLKKGGLLVRTVVVLLFYLSQKTVEARHFRQRNTVLKSDRQQAQLLAFSGGME